MSIEEMPEELLSAYLDGECTPEEVASVEQRLADDPEWRAILDEVRETRWQLRALPMREAPEGFVETLLEDPLLEEPAPVIELKRKKQPNRVLTYAAGIAAVFAGVMVAIPNDSSPSVTPAVATFAETHAATSSLDSDPVSALAPVVVPVGFTP